MLEVMNGQNNFSTDLYHPMKKFLPSPKFLILPPPTGRGDFSPTPLMLFGKP